MSLLHTQHRLCSTFEVLKSWHMGRAWPIYRQHSQSGPIMGQSEPSAIDDQTVSMFHNKFTQQIHLVIGSIGHPCSTIQGSTRYLSLIRPSPQPILYCSSVEGGICLWWDHAICLLPCWTYNHYPRSGL